MGKKKGIHLKDLQEFGGSMWFLLKWFLISVGIGVIVGGVSSAFGHTLIFVNNLRTQYPWLIYFLPAAA